jgi:hypothetical protein
VAKLRGLIPGRLTTLREQIDAQAEKDESKKLSFLTDISGLKSLSDTEKNQFVLNTLIPEVILQKLH